MKDLKKSNEVLVQSFLRMFNVPAGGMRPGTVHYALARGVAPEYLMHTTCHGHRDDAGANSRATSQRRTTSGRHVAQKVQAAATWHRRCREASAHRLHCWEIT